MNYKIKNYKKYGFTLAEVLITIAIIGVVAAITLPSVTANIKKETVEKKLVSTYSILANALRMSEAHNGGMSNWDLTVYQNVEDANNQTLDYRRNRVEVFDTYLMPYLKTVNKSSGEAKALKDLGYKTPWKAPNGEISIEVDREVYPIILNNGTVLFPRSGYHLDESTGKKYYRWLSLYIDLDGPKGNNIIGKDIFIFVIPLKSGFTLAAYGEYDGYDRDKKTFVDYYSEADKLQQCKNGDKTGARYCAYFIKKNSWKFPKDYPWM